MASGVFGPAAAVMAPLAEAPPPHPARAPATRAPRIPSLASTIRELVDPCLCIALRLPVTDSAKSESSLSADALLSVNIHADSIYAAHSIDRAGGWTLAYAAVSLGIAGAPQHLRNLNNIPAIQRPDDSAGALCRCGEFRVDSVACRARYPRLGGVYARAPDLPPCTGRRRCAGDTGFACGPG